MHISGPFSCLLEIYKPDPSQASCDDLSRVRVRDAAATRDFRRLRSHFQLRPAAFHVNGGHRRLAATEEKQQTASENRQCYHMRT